MNSEKIKKLLKNKSFLFWMSLVVMLTAYLKPWEGDRWKSSGRPIDPVRAEAENIGVTLEEFAKRYNEKVVTLDDIGLQWERARSIKISKLEWDGKSALARLTVDSSIVMYVLLDPETHNIIKIILYSRYYPDQWNGGKAAKGEKVRMCMWAVACAVEPEYNDEEKYGNYNEHTYFSYLNAGGIYYSFSRIDIAVDTDLEGCFLRVQKAKDPPQNPGEQRKWHRIPGETPVPYKGKGRMIGKWFDLAEFTQLFDYYACTSGKDYLITYYEGDNDSRDTVLTTGCNVKMYIHGGYIERILVTGHDAGNPESRKDIFDAIDYAVNVVDTYDGHRKHFTTAVYKDIFNDCYNGEVKIKTNKYQGLTYHYEESEETGEIFFEIY